MSDIVRTYDICRRLMDDMPLFDEPVAHVRASDPVTSHAVAASVTNIRQSQEAILYVLKTQGNLTDEQIYPFVCKGMSPSGARSRRNELCSAGLVLDSGQRGKTSSGRSTIIWQACS